MSPNFIAGPVKHYRDFVFFCHNTTRLVLSIKAYRHCCRARRRNRRSLQRWTLLLTLQTISYVQLTCI